MTRVAIGPFEVAGTSAALAYGFRAIGVEAEVVLRRPPHPFGYPADRVLGRPGRIVYGLTAPLRRDVFHLQFGASWLPAFVDARWARACGRTLVGGFYGDDCRLAAVAHERFPARGRVKDPKGDPPVLRRLEVLGRLCHAAVVADRELAAYVEPFFERIYLLPVPLLPDPAPATLAPWPPGKTLVVLHAPSDPEIKGTAAIEAAVAAVARRVPLELKLLTGVPHELVAQELGRADVVVDQLNSVTTGVFALEAMRAGLPVLAEFQHSALAPYQQRSPVVAVTPETLERELERLAGDGERRLRLGEEGREFVARTHDPRRVAAALLHVYRHTRTDARGTFEADPDGIRAVN